MRKLVALALLAVPLLTACGGAHYSEAAHRSAVESELGHPIPDAQWTTIVNMTTAECKWSKDPEHLRVMDRLAHSEFETDPVNHAEYLGEYIGVSLMCSNHFSPVVAVPKTGPTARLSCVTMFPGDSSATAISVRLACLDSPEPDLFREAMGDSPR